jgi:exonuclease III/cell division protein FtsB
MATLTTSLEQKIDSKLGEAGNAMEKNMEKILTTQQQENQTFQRELMFSNQTFQANLFGTMVTHMNDNQSRNNRAFLMQSDLSELTTRRLMLRDKVLSIGTPKTSAAQSTLQEYNRQIEFLNAEIKDLRDQQNNLFANAQPLTMPAPPPVILPSKTRLIDGGEDPDETEDEDTNPEFSRKRLRTEQKKPISKFKIKSKELESRQVLEIKDSQEDDIYGGAQPMDISPAVYPKESLPAKKTHLYLTQTVTNKNQSLPTYSPPTSIPVIPTSPLKPPDLQCSSSTSLQSNPIILASSKLDPLPRLQSRSTPLPLIIQLFVLCFSVLSFQFFRPRLRRKTHSSVLSPLFPRSPTHALHTSMQPGSWANEARVRFFGSIARDNVKTVIVLRRSCKDHRTRSSYPRKCLQYAYLASILALLIPQVSAAATTSNGISIWTLNLAGTGTALKMNSVHNHIMNGNPDIFVLTDTRSDGSTLKSHWDWKDYQVREQKGYGRLRNGGIVMGIKKHLPITQEHTDIPGMDGRLLHLTIKTIIRGKGTRIKVIGVYAPPCASESAAAADFFQTMRTWMDSLPAKDSDWIIAGDLNLSLSRTEASDQTFSNHRPARTEYWKILSLPKSPGFDWWTKRERNRAEDFTRRKWGEVNDTLSGKSIIDRVASSFLFESTEIKSRPDLFIGNTDHVWVQALAKIRGLS